MFGGFSAHVPHRAVGTDHVPLVLYEQYYLLGNLVGHCHFTLTCLGALFLNSFATPISSWFLFSSFVIRLGTCGLNILF